MPLQARQAFALDESRQARRDRTGDTVPMSNSQTHGKNAEPSMGSSRSIARAARAVWYFLIFGVLFAMDVAGETELAMVQRHVQESERHVRQQRVRIALLRKSGLVTDDADNFLEEILRVLGMHQAHLNRLKAQDSIKGTN